MAAFSQKIFSDAFSWMKGFVFWLKFYWFFSRNGPIDNNAALINIIARRRMGDKQPSGPMLTRFGDACLRH